MILIGIDGFDWRVLRRVIEQGKAPNLERFLERGPSGELITMTPAYSPVIWTSMATGKLPAKHGITGFVKQAQGDSGRPVPFTSNSVRTRPVWSILGELGRESAVVGWWTTWPAQPLSGVIVSDRMLYNRFNLWFGLDHSGADLPAQTHPPELFDELLPLTRATDELEREFRATFVPDAPGPVIQQDLHDPWYELFLVYARDRAYASMLDRVLERGPFDFVAFYLNGPDIASHYFWKHLFPEEWDEPIPPEELARNSMIIESYYAWVDRTIGPLLESADEHRVVIVVSDHGFVTGRRADSPNISGTHYRAAPPGIVAMAGGGLVAGGETGQGSVLDVAPSVLHLLGHPVGRDMDGRVLPAVESATGGRSVRFVDSHDVDFVPQDADPLTSPFDDGIVAKLRALGYLD